MKKLLFALLCSIGMTASAQAETIGISMSLFDDNFLTILRKKMMSHIGTKDGVKARAEDAQGDISRQQSQIENFIASGVDGIIVQLVDADSGVAISKTAQRAGVPLIFVNQLPTGIENLPKGQAYVGSDEIQAGLLQADFICKTLKGKGNVVVIQGGLGTNGQRGRTKGVHEGFTKEGCKGIKIIEEQSANWFRMNALDLMTNWLSAGFKFDAVASNNDEMALGAIQAMKAASIFMDKVIVAGVDGTPDALAAIKAGDLDASVFQNAEGQGIQAVDAILKLVNGENVDKIINIPFEPITKENFKEYINRN
ncbi:sugar ABC transporter substrate-binding protein [Bartonella sp. HY329]|uniref:sugar ABC transporter substrate-binding protein n=1 Tax=unclassified Bartonella TaxID=2645622 RepID=UPI0021C72B91|nr:MULTISPECIES: sugar ABC transporter substrate-binding protein [unclassified Bartonella]UXM94409.1 sugar ABC transporter substrate-binding protein [Bartonella sp. HY329]UXN08733.1 sugar ABC transporter substrate-binding protein [Bartonella sp. HY328]